MTLNVPGSDPARRRTATFRPPKKPEGPGPQNHQFQKRKILTGRKGSIKDTKVPNPSPNLQFYVTVSHCLSPVSTRFPRPRSPFLFPTLRRFSPRSHLPVITWPPRLARVSLGFWPRAATPRARRIVSMDADRILNHSHRSALLPICLRVLESFFFEVFRWGFVQCLDLPVRSSFSSFYAIRWCFGGSEMGLAVRIMRFCWVLSSFLDWMRFKITSRACGLLFLLFLASSFSSMA